MGKCQIRNDKMTDSGNIKVVTLSRADKREANYYRLSLYEFKGNPLIAYFEKDLEQGFWFKSFAEKAAFNKAKELGIMYVPDISMGDSIDKVFKRALG